LLHFLHLCSGRWTRPPRRPVQAPPSILPAIPQVIPAHYQKKVIPAAGAGHSTAAGTLWEALAARELTKHTVPYPPSPIATLPHAGLTTVGLSSPIYRRQSIGTVCHSWSSVQNSDYYPSLRSVVSSGRRRCHPERDERPSAVVSVGKGRDTSRGLGLVLDEGTNLYLVRPLLPWHCT
jgi:hypothetical protein